MNTLNFKLMALTFKIRDLFSPPRKVVAEAAIKSGDVVLDFGCGPGSFSLAASELVGAGGKVYALDIHPLAVEMVRQAASKKGLTNIEVIQSDGETGLEESSVDVVMLYDAYHDLADPHKVLRELHRVLKPEGTLSFSDHHLKESQIISGLTETGLFRLSTKGKKTFSFRKELSSLHFVQGSA